MKKILQYINNTLIEINEIIVNLTLRIVAILLMLSAAMPFAFLIFDLGAYLSNNTENLIINSWFELLKYIGIATMGWYLGYAINNIINPNWAKKKDSY